MSVRIGTRCCDLIDARIRSPSRSPGPRYDAIDVRLALSYDALNTNGTPARVVISTSRAARAVAWASLSTTQGPAMSTNGRPPPNVMPPSCTGDTATLSTIRVWRLTRVPGAAEPRQTT